MPQADFHGERDMAMLNAAVCGLGWWGGRLVESVAGSNLIRFTRGYTRNPAAHAEFAERTGIAVGASYDDILADPAIHAVVLATAKLPTPSSARALSTSSPLTSGAISQDS